MHKIMFTFLYPCKKLHSSIRFGDLEFQYVSPPPKKTTTPNSLPYQVPAMHLTTHFEKPEKIKAESRGDHVKNSRWLDRRGERRCATIFSRAHRPPSFVCTADTRQLGMGDKLRRREGEMFGLQGDRTTGNVIWGCLL